MIILTMIGARLMDTAHINSPSRQKREGTHTSACSTNTLIISHNYTVSEH